MPNYQKLVAMGFAGIGGLGCLFMGDPTLHPLAAALLSGMMAFAVGEVNGAKNEREKQTDN